MPPKPDYSPVPTVRPQGPRDPSELVHINFPHVEFSGAVGKAMAEVGRLGYGVLGDATAGVAKSLDNLGNQLEHTGDKLWQRAVGLQELQLETDVTKREIEYERWLGDKNTQFQLNQGEAASEATLKAHIKEVEEKRNKMGEGLPQKGQQMWDRRTASSMLSSIRSASEHAAKETRKAAAGASGARVDMKTDQFSKEDNIKESERLFKEAHDEFFNTKAPLMGWGSDRAQAEWEKEASKMYSSKITRIASDDAKRGWDMLQENKHLMTGDDFTRVENTVKTQFRLQYSRNISKEIQDKNPDAPYEEKRDQIEKRVNEVQEKTGIKDPLLLEATEQRLSAEHTRHNREKKEEYDKNLFTAKDSAFGYGAPGGKKPKVHEELWAIPGAKEAYDALKPDDKRAVDKVLADNNKDDYAKSPQTEARKDTLYGEAGSDRPEDREAFMQRNLNEEKIPWSDRDKLKALQRKMRGEQGRMNPLVDKAMKVSTDLLPENIRTWRHPEIKKQFEGALRTALELKMEENKGVPLKDDDYRNIVSNLLRDIPGTGWFAWMGGTPFYQKIKEPTSEDLRQLKNEFPEMNEEQLRNEYAITKYKFLSKEYEGLKAKPPATDARRVGPKAGGPSVPQSQ